MTEPFDTIIPTGAPPPSPFPATSRYHEVPLATWELAPGRPVRYLRRRFVPSPDRFVLLHEHQVGQGERPDTVAAAELGDAQQWWRLADANRAMRPEELTETVGRRLRITLPEGIPGVSGG